MDYFNVEHLDFQKLIADWRWLYSGAGKLIARSAYGDLFIEEVEQGILKLDIHAGEIHPLTKTRRVFDEGLHDPVLRDEWFAEVDEQAAAKRGFQPGPVECLAFKTPLVLVGGGGVYVADLYEAVGFLGDFHRQIRDVSDGAQIRIVVGAPRRENPSE